MCNEAEDRRVYVSMRFGRKKRNVMYKSSECEVFNAEAADIHHVLYSSSYK